MLGWARFALVALVTGKETRPPVSAKCRETSGVTPPSGAEAYPLAVGYDFHAKGGMALCGFLAYSSAVPLSGRGRNWGFPV